MDVAGPRLGYGIGPEEEGLNALDQTTWAGSGSRFHCMKNLMPSWPELTVKETSLKTMMELVTYGQEMKNLGGRTTSVTPGSREVGVTQHLL